MQPENPTPQQWRAPLSLSGLEMPIIDIIAAMLLLTVILLFTVPEQQSLALFPPFFLLLALLNVLPNRNDEVVITASQEGLNVQLPGDMSDDIPWASLTVVRRAGRTRRQAWATVIRLLAADHLKGADLGGPLVEFGTRWFTWRASCPDPDGFLHTVYQHRPDLASDGGLRTF